MTIIYRTDGAWGVGISRDLFPAELDGNFWDCASRITTLESWQTAGGTTISSLTLSGNTFYVNMSDGAVIGPYTLPKSSLRWRGEWQPSTIYLSNDIFTNGGTVYIVNVDHTSDTTFDAGAVDPDTLALLYGYLLQAPGSVVPVGGTTGQALAKKTDADYDTQWQGGLAPIGGTTGQVLRKKTSSDYDLEWANAATLVNLHLYDLLDVAVATNPDDASVLTWNANAQAWQAMPGASPGRSWPLVNASYTPSVGDESSFVLSQFSGTVTITIPTNASQPFALDTEITLCSDATGNVINVVGDTGVSVQRPVGYLAQSLCQNAVLTVKKVSIDTWKLFGLLAPDV